MDVECIYLSNGNISFLNNKCGNGPETLAFQVSHWKQLSTHDICKRHLCLCHSCSIHLVLHNKGNKYQYKMLAWMLFLNSLPTTAFVDFLFMASRKTRLIKLLDNGVNLDTSGVLVVGTWDLRFFDCFVIFHLVIWIL